jgi:hypothetical protein
MSAPVSLRPQPEDMYGSRWLIIHGGGPASEEIARSIAEQCRRLWIKTSLMAIDDCRDVELARYTSLVVVLPTLSSSTNIRRALEPFANIIGDYRMRWRDGLSSILDGTTELLDAGVVQLFGERALLHNPTMRTALKKACYVQGIDEDRPIDALLPYYHTSETGNSTAPWDELGDVAGDTVHQTWLYVQEWGVDDLTAISKILYCINMCRSHFENPKKPQLYRPKKNLQRNRLDIILDGPDTVEATKKAQKAWAENGARVWRYVLGRLQEVVPQVGRPGRSNAPGAQNDLRRLYESLKFLDSYLRSSGERLPTIDS